MNETSTTKLSRSTAIIALAAIVTLLPTLALAGPHGRRGGHGPGCGSHGGPGFGGPGLARILWQLDLSEDQKGTIEGILESYQEELDAEHEAARAAGQALRDATHGEVFDEGAIRAAAQQAAAAREEVIVTTAQMRQELHNVLTTEQRAQIEEMREQRQALMEEHREHFEQRGGRGFGRGRDWDAPPAD